jgi:hypothetical protein
MRNRIWIPDPHKSEKFDPDPHQSEKVGSGSVSKWKKDPDQHPHQGDEDPQYFLQTCLLCAIVGSGERIRLCKKSVICFGG